MDYQQELFKNSLKLNNINWSYDIDKDSFEALIKIRYNMPAVRSTIKKDKTGWVIDFNEPISAITKGQACVIYDINDGHLLGGEFI